MATCKYCTNGVEFHHLYDGQDEGTRLYLSTISVCIGCLPKYREERQVEMVETYGNYFKGIPYDTMLAKCDGCGGLGIDAMTPDFIIHKPHAAWMDVAQKKHPSAPTSLPTVVSEDSEESGDIEEQLSGIGLYESDSAFEGLTEKVDKLVKKSKKVKEEPPTKVENPKSHTRNLDLSDLDL